MKIISPDELDSYVQSEEQISARLTTPLVLTFVDTDKINFERSRSGFWGWGGDKSESVSGYETKVFGANNVELITRTRTEHLTEEDKKRAKSNKNPLQSFLGKVARRQNFIPYFPWIAPGWLAGGRSGAEEREGIQFCSVA